MSDKADDLLETSLASLWNEPPNSNVLKGWLEALSSTGAPIPEIKVYSDAVYYNYFPLGLSLLFQPASGYKPKNLAELDPTRLTLQSIDIYNDDPAARYYAAYPQYPLVIPPRSAEPAVSVTPHMVGKDFVQALGEPDRKGGGSGPSSGSIGVWCEWTKLGLMVELGGDDVRGPQAWEKGKDAKWKTITLFSAAPSA